MHIRLMTAALAAGVASRLVGATAEAQPIGTFSWQLQPFCNVVTVTVTQQGGVYTLDGYDDQCGAPTVASVVGTAIPNHALRKRRLGQESHSVSRRTLGITHGMCRWYVANSTPLATQSAREPTPRERNGICWKLSQAWLSGMGRKSSGTRLP